MSDHTTALVPLESWCYNSPELIDQNKSIDIGLLAEALIYYDCVILNVGTQPQFAELLRWFMAQNKFEDFLALVNDGVIKIYDYGFITAPILKDGVYSIYNVQNELEAKPNSFERRILYHEAVQSCLANNRQGAKLYRTFRGKVIEAKADEFSRAIENARHDFSNINRTSLIMQAFVDELYLMRKLGKPPEIHASISASADGTKKMLTWNIDLALLSKIAGKNLNFHHGTPLAAGAISNRLLWSAALLKCDLYLGQPGSILIGDKLFESSIHINNSHSIIEELKERVEFPDIRLLVNHGRIDLNEILRIRKKSRKFREWLQTEADRDRDALIAYHHEVSKELGIMSAGRKTLIFFGAIGGGALGAYVGNVIASSEGAMFGGAAGSGLSYIVDISSKLGADWKPIVFGNWFKERIEKVLDRGTE